jgi:hypothetical protein
MELMKQALRDLYRWPAQDPQVLDIGIEVADALNAAHGASSTATSSRETSS